MQNNLGRFGHYCVGPHKFYSKFDAAEFAAKTDQRMTWHYHDEIFSQRRWSVEPTESLPELYRKRAQQLRDRYDYLVLWYSGGSDSDNILDTFVDNNIPLDEVAGCVNTDATKSTHGWVNSEIYHISVPKVQQIQQTTQPWLRHTLVDMCKPTLDYFTNTANKFDWIYKANEYVNPSFFGRVQAIKQQRHWQDLITQGKKIGFIWGIDKPRVSGINDHYYFAFKDMLDSASTSHQQYEDTDGYSTEMFYWTPDLPDLVIKQCHVLKNLLKKLTASSELLSLTNNERLNANSMVVKQGKIYWLTVKATCAVLYPKWYDRPFQFKAPSLLFTPRDTWFFNLPDNELAKKIWQQGLKHRWDSTPDFLKNDPKNMARDFKLMNSQRYNLGT